jgi:glycerophosphoryl diester phosphodiesterase
MMWSFPRIIAHRGGGTLAPENTLAALRCGVAHGFRGVEFDVMALPDGALVLMHDTELGRTVSGSGPVADQTFASLSASDAGAWFSAEFAGETVPSFAQAAQFCIEHQLWMNVEIKPLPGTEVATGRWVAQACAGLPAGAVLLSSFSTEALREAQAVAPKSARGLLVERVPPDWHQQLDQLGAVSLHAQAGALTAAQASAVKRAGFGLMCYTVNDPAQARTLFDWGVDAICTDRLDLITPDFQ